MTARLRLIGVGWFLFADATRRLAYLMGALVLLSAAPFARAQINVCGSICDPPGYGACPNTEAEYFSKVSKGVCRLHDDFKAQFGEWKLARDARQAEVNKEVTRLGKHREAEARRLVDLRERAAKARGKPVPHQSQEKTAATDATCRMVTGRGSQRVPANYLSRQVAESALRFDAGTSCKTRPNRGNVPILSGLKCSSRQAKGIISGKMQAYWSCSADFVCSMPHEVCDGRTGQGSAQ